MSDLYRYIKFAECKVCGTRYHIDQDTNQVRCNGRAITRCIAFHKESDPPHIQLENMNRFINKEPELNINRSDWYSPGGEILE